MADAANFVLGTDYVLGIDISRWQWGKPVPFLGLYRRGVRFCFSKATHGLGSDATFEKGYRGSLDAGLYRGAYHWHVPGQDPKKQAEHFVAMVDKAGGFGGAMDLPLAVDFEDVNVKVKGKQLVEEIEALCDHVWVLTGRAPILYTGNWYYEGYALNVESVRLGSLPLWLALYPGLGPGVDPVEGWKDAADRVMARGKFKCPVPWAQSGALFHQFDGDGGLKLDNGTDVDVNIFHGSEADLGRLCAGSERVLPKPWREDLPVEAVDLRAFLKTLSDPAQSGDAGGGASGDTGEA